MKSLLKSALAIGFAGAMVAGCSTTYSRDELIKDLKAGGLSDKAATCTADGFDKAGIKLEKYEEAKKDSKQVEIAAKCIAEEAGITLPTTPPG